jgi:hypothetical protein
MRLENVSSGNVLKRRLTAKDKAGKFLLQTRMSGRRKRCRREEMAKLETEVQIQVFESVVRDGEEGDTRWK